ncbi:DNA-processing protein DprA [Aeromicrobium sp.]|uniref:DNA-processing protein DprA n=1 Tax=Aeromicrobium sp. TaxID=1871063 RepID=UPI0019A30EB6|nr:DNA-processing protein DprA [Aeromicrobium sp.]MBC7633097.1 DNA-protecting protein DprA [Aeromicrobium sp.]
MSSTRQDRLALSLVVEPGDPRLRDLLLDLEPGAIVAAVRGRHARGQPRVPEAWSERGHDLDRTVETARARAAAGGLRWLCPGDHGWPGALSDLDHVEPLHGATGAPLGLWVRGKSNLAALSQTSVAIVGARECTTYGAECASELAIDCADAGYTVISGAAYGVDGCAHRGAVMMGSPTVAVLACGADIDYPLSHGALLARIAEDGLVVSEQAPGQRPMKGRFLSRNRLIAALTQGTVVIEAASRSGSLNTLSWADQLGRTTMGLPGPVTSRQSTGVHAALRGGKAVLVTSGKDVVEEMRGLGADSADEAPLLLTDFDRLPPTAQKALDGLDWSEPRSASEVAVVAHLSARQVGPALALLERRALASRIGSGWLLSRRADVG